MATVPTLGLAQVQTNAPANTYQTANAATPDAFGAAGGAELIRGGQQLAQAGDKLGRLAEKLQFDDDAREAKDAETKFRLAQNTILRGDATAQNPGYLGSQGQQALDGYKPAREALDKTRQDLEAGIKSERARRIFGEAAQQHIATAEERMLSHSSQQRVVADDTTSQARVDSAASEAGLFWNDDKAISKSLGVAQAEALDTARRKGLPAEVANRMVTENTTKVVSTAIRNAVELDPVRAQKLYVENVGKIDGREAAVLRKIVEEKALVSESQAAAQKIYAEAKLKGLTLDQTAALVRDRLTGKVQDETIARIHTMYGEIDRATATANAARQLKRNGEEDAAVAAYDKIRKASPTAEAQLEQARTTLNGRILQLVTGQINNERAADAGAMAERERLNRTSAFRALDEGKDPATLAPDVKASLTLGQMEHMQKVYSDRLAGFPPVTNWDKYSEYIAQAKDPDQARYIDLTEAKTYLATADFRRISELKANAEAGKLDPNAKNDAGAINTTLVGLGFNTAAKKDDKARLADAMHAEIDAARAAAPNGRISDEERDRILLYAKKKYVTEPSAFASFFGYNSAENTDATKASASGAIGFNERFAGYLASQSAEVAARLKVRAPPPQAYLAASGRMPPAERTEIIASLKRTRGITNPSEAEIRTLYAIGLMREAK